MFSVKVKKPQNHHSANVISTLLDLGPLKVIPNFESHLPKHHEHHVSAVASLFVSLLASAMKSHHKQRDEFDLKKKKKNGSKSCYQTDRRVHSDE
ncbi:hypothetical protein Mapa_002633 [Marchantia paleacea]|nr:hypothetical protein Mapa_002633 [Marchantia paleacea]